MYVGMALMVLGAALFLGSVSALLAVLFFCLMLQEIFIKPEEQRLEGWFGDDYRAYRRKVRRWV
jgi:protein-S-isoprenylcysteine O-methyltransferase Ste14